MKSEIIIGNCLDVLPTLPEKSVQCVVTSPPYYGLRDYGCDGQIGLEDSPELYVDKLVTVFREVKRVLRDDGVVWLNLGDSYGKTKQLYGIPWRVAFALQSDGWYLRQDIIWSKPNPMPENVTDRFTKSHEYIFLLTKTAKYFMNMDAVREPHETMLKYPNWNLGKGDDREPCGKRMEDGFQGGMAAKAKNNNAIASWNPLGRNRHSVWTIATKPFKEAHFATFSPELPTICIKAGTKIGDTILDPFSGAGTVGMVCEKLDRNFIGIELNPSYVKMAEKRVDDVRLPILDYIRQG